MPTKNMTTCCWYSTVLVLLLCVRSKEAATESANLRAKPSNQQERERQVQASSYYHTLSANTLGPPNPSAAIGNPLKGLVESPIYTNPPYQADIPLSVEFYYLDFDRIMKGNPKIVGEANAFDWDYLDQTLIGSASRQMHAVWRVIIDFPGQPLKIPQYLLDAGVDIRWYGEKSSSPYYGDAKLLEAIEQFITYSGKRYDTDKRLGFLQCGLLGFWGEFHTFGHDYIPDGVREKVIGWYSAAYKETQLQVRYPEKMAYEAGFGRHDDSFGYETLDGDANGKVAQEWYYWPDLVRKGQSDSWKRGAMGGEVRGEISNEIFEQQYKARTYHKQSFMECVNVTHTTWIFHHVAFREGGFKGTELTNARFAHARMGYNFHVPSISVKSASVTSATVDIDVNITQIGVAPFYYDLALGMKCPDMSMKVVKGLETLIDKGESKTMTFTGIPATETCLSALSLSMESSYAYDTRLIKFAQKNGTLTFKLPLPGSSAPLSDAGLEDVPAKCRLACRLKRLFTKIMSKSSGP